MGKGFNNYMCKKFFHPASRDNLKRVWMAEQQADAYKKKQEELRTQYEKEQNLHENKAMLSKESKDKLSVNFMYEPPPGVRKERDKDTAEPEYKFEWQRKFNAPRESYCKGDTEIRDQPFGIQVRNVRCIKCHKWGHINTDKECSMYSISMSEARKIHSEAEANEMMAKNVLEEQMKQDGLVMKRSALELQNVKHITQEHKFLPSDDEADFSNGNDGGECGNNVEVTFLKSLSTKQKMKLLKKLEKIEKLKKEKLDKKVKKQKKEKSKHKKTKSSRRSRSSSTEDSDSNDELDKKSSKQNVKSQKRCDRNENERSRNVSSFSDSSTDSKEKIVHKNEKSQHSNTYSRRSRSSSRSRRLQNHSQKSDYRRESRETSHHYRNDTRHNNLFVNGYNDERRRNERDSGDHKRHTNARKRRHSRERSRSSEKRRAQTSSRYSSDKTSRRRSRSRSRH